MDAGFFRGTTSEQDARFTDKQKKLIKSMKFQPSLGEKIDMEKVNLDVLKPWITKRVTELLSGIEDEVLIGYIFELLESSRHPDPKKMQIDITGFLNGKNARIFMGELWSHLHSAQVNIGGIPADFLEKKKEEIRQRKKETELIQESLKKSLSVVEADSTSREHKYRPKRAKELPMTPSVVPTVALPDLSQTPAMQDQLEIRKSLVGYMTSPASTPMGRDKPGWYAEHEKHVEIAKTSSAGVLLIGDSIIQGLARYPKIWSQYFSPLKSLNFGLGGDRTQNVLWRVENGEIPLNGQTIVIHVGTNNTDRDQPKDIANGIGSIAMMFQEAKPNAKIILTGLLPRDLQPSHRRKQVAKVNKYLKKLCTSGHIRNFYYLKPDNDWLLPDGMLNTSYYFHDYLHLLEEGDEKFAKSIYNIITKVYSGNKIEMSSDSEISGDEGYTFERIRGGEPQAQSPPRPSRYRSPKRSRSRSPRRSRSSSRSRSRRRTRSRTPRRHSRSPTRKRYRGRRHSHSRSRSRHRSRSVSRSPRRRTRRRSLSHSRSPLRVATTNNNLRELAKIPSPSPPPTHGKVNEKTFKPDVPALPTPNEKHIFSVGSMLTGLQSEKAEQRRHGREFSEEPVKIKPADEGLMRGDPEQATFATKSDKSQTRTYRRRNSASEESEPHDAPKDKSPEKTTKEEDEEKSPMRKSSPPTRSPPPQKRKSRSPQKKSKPLRRSPSFSPSPPPKKGGSPRKKSERRDSPSRRKIRGADGKKTGERDSSSDRSTSPQVRKRHSASSHERKRRSSSPQARKRRQQRRKREQEARDKKAVRVEREKESRVRERETREKEREAREKERKLAERLREKHRQRQRQKRSPSLSESESESDHESRRKKMVEAAARRIAQASESECEVEEKTKKKRAHASNSKEDEKYKWKVKKGNSSDDSADEPLNDENHRKTNKHTEVPGKAIKRDESSDEGDKKDMSCDQVRSAEDPESEMEDASRHLVESIKSKIKCEEYEYEEEFDESANSKNIKSSKSNEMQAESSSEEEEPENQIKRNRKHAEEVHSRRGRKHVSRGNEPQHKSSHGSRANDSPQKSSRRKDSSESAYESSENEVNKRRVVAKPSAHTKSPSPSPVKYSKQKSLSPSPVKHSKQKSLSPSPVKYSKQKSHSPLPVKHSKQKSHSPLPVKHSKQKSLSPSPVKHSKQKSHSPSPMKHSKQKSRSSSRERAADKRKYERKQESEAEEVDEEEDIVKGDNKPAEEVGEESEAEESEQDTSPERERRRRKSSKRERRHRHKKSSKKKKKSKKRRHYSDDDEDEDSDVERQLRERALKSMRKKARRNSSDSSS